MVEATITKSQVVLDKGALYLLATAEHADEMVNIKAKFFWEELDKRAFIKDLQEKIAEAFDIPAYYVDVKGPYILAKMEIAANKALVMGAV